MIERAIDSIENIALVQILIAVGAPGPDEPFHAVNCHVAQVGRITPEIFFTVILQIKAHGDAGLAKVRKTFHIQRALFCFCQ